MCTLYPTPRAETALAESPSTSCLTAVTGGFVLINPGMCVSENTSKQNFCAKRAANAGMPGNKRRVEM